MPTDLVTLSRKVTFQRQTLEDFAVCRGYQEKIIKTPDQLPDRFDEVGNLIPYAIEEMLIANPQTKIEWLQDWFDARVIEMFSIDIEADEKRKAEELANATIQTVKEAIASGITRE